MASIFDSLKSLVSPELINTASAALGENSSGMVKAASAAIPALLGSILAKGNDPKVESALEKAGNANDSILTSITSIFSGKGDDSTSSIGSGLLDSILGKKLGGLTTLISSISGISGKGSSGLLSMITPLIGGFLGKKMLSGGSGLSGLLSTLTSEKSSFLSAMPSGLTDVLGVSSLANLGGAADHVAKEAKHAVKEVKHVAEEAVSEVKSSLSWLKWFIPLLIIGGAFFWWKSCNDKVKQNTEDAIKSSTAAVGTAAGTVVEKVKSLLDFELPNGIKLKGFQNGIEEQMIGFLKSDKYKTLDEATLKDTWFNFDNINFEFGSSTALTPESVQQVDNVVAILKHYKDAKIKIGAYTDKKGDAATNLKISQERANTIKQIFTDKGIGHQIAGAEGYGDKFAKVAVDASDDERATDRRVAIRFDKK